VDEDMSKEIDLMGGNLETLVEKAFQSLFLYESESIIEGIVDLVLHERANIPFFRLFDPQGTAFLCLLEIEGEFGKAREVPNESLQKMEAVIGRNHLKELRERIETNNGMGGVESELKTRGSRFDETGYHLVHINSLFPDALKNLNRLVYIRFLNLLL
jgi:hypothetical protein